MKKFLWRLVFLLVVLAPFAHGEVTMTVKSKSKQMRAFQNFETRVAQLENYSVVYSEADGAKKVMKSASARQSKRVNDLTVELRPAKKKS